MNNAVLKAYGFDAKLSVLEQLLELNHEVAKREAGGEAAVGPGRPKGLKLPAPLQGSVFPIPPHPVGKQA